MASFDPARAANAQRIVNVTAAQAGLRFSVGLQAAVGQAYRHLGEQLPAAVEAVGRSIDLRAVPSSRLKAANLEIAEAARARVAESWRSRLPRDTPSYRKGPRLTGALGEAFNDTSMIAGTTDRVISFLDVTKLNNSARHWARVNYGAQGEHLAEGQSARTFSLEANGIVLAQLRDDAPPARYTWLPRRFFWAGGQLVPLRGPADRQGTKGAAAAHFTDLGLEVVARQFFPVYNAMLHQYVSEAAGQAKAERLAITVQANLFGAGLGVTAR